jgi:hypothetical protein
MTRRRIAIFAFLVSSFVFVSCAARQKTVTNLPAGVTQTQVQQWDTAVANLDKIASTTSAVRQAVIAINQVQAIPAPYYGRILTALGKIDQAQISAAAMLKAYPNTWTPGLAAQLQQYLTIISAQLTSITQDGLAGIKDANSQKQITTLIAEITAAVNLVLTLSTS